jgi:DNA invertase Pin-like site-specific DNA recombinase
MIAAIYARRATEPSGVGEEEKSVTRQVEHARAYAARKGWTVAEEHVYVDDGISGAEFVKGPGLARLMNNLKPHPPFQVLVIAEESRLGRKAIETGRVLAQIIDAEVRVFFYVDNHEMDTVMLSLTNVAAEREMRRQRRPLGRTTR